MNEFTKGLRNWMKERPSFNFVNSLAETCDTLDEVLKIDINFKVGDRVIFTNDYGFSFGPYTIQGISKNYDVNGRRIFIDKESFWFPCSAKNLKLA